MTQTFDKVAVAVQYLTDASSMKITPHRHFSKVVTVVRIASESNSPQEVIEDITEKAQDLLFMMAKTELPAIIDGACDALLSYAGDNVVGFPADQLPVSRPPKVGINLYPLVRKVDPVVDCEWTTKQVKQMLLECGSVPHADFFSDIVKQFQKQKTDYLITAVIDEPTINKEMTNVRERSQFMIERYDLEGVLSIEVKAFSPSVMQLYPNLRQQKLNIYFDLNPNGTLGGICHQETKHMLSYTLCNFQVNPK